MNANVIRLRGYERIRVFGDLRNADIIGYANQEDSKQWAIELNAFNLRTLRKMDCEFGEELQKIYKSLFANKTDKEIKPKTLKSVLPYQQEAIRWLYIKKGRALLGDDMGLGKTIDIIGVVSAVPEKFLPMVVLCPAHIKLNWRDEFQDWTGDRFKVDVLFGRTPRKIDSDTDVIVLNPHILKEWIPEILKLNPKWLVIDEAHSFVSTKTATWEVARGLSNEIGRTCLVTGTAVVNYVKDLWGLLELVNHRILGGYTSFVSRFSPENSYEVKRRSFCKYGWGRKQKMSFSVEPTVTEKDITLLNNVLKSTVLLRRVKSDPELAKQLPEKVRKVYRIRVEDSKFWKAERELRIKIKEELRELGIKKDVPVSMKSYSRMRRIVGEAKLPDMIEWIKRWQRNNPKSKLVVTGWHVDLLTKLNEEFPMSYLVTGKVDTHKKYKIGKMFNTKEGHPLLFGNVKSIGTGINLTAADTMLFVELPYTGVDVAQVEDRLHRLCQKAKTVYYFYFIVEGSLEEKLLSYISRKQRTAGAVLDAKATDTLEDVLEDSDRVSPLLLKSLV